VRAFNVRTGATLWEFRSVGTKPGEPNFDTWAGGSAINATGAISWSFSMTLDPGRNTLYAISAPDA